LKGKPKLTQINKMAAVWDLILIIIAFFLPPLAAFFKKGLHHEFWISVLLTILGWLPGVLYTWWIILSRHHTARYHYAPRRFGNANVGNPVVNPVANPVAPRF